MVLSCVFSSVEFINKHYLELIQRIGITISKQITDDLHSINIISVEEKDIILSKKVSQDVARSLIQTTLKKGEESCDHFVKSLKIRDQYLFHDLIGEYVIGDVEEEDINDLTDDLKTLYTSPGFQRFYPLGDDTGIDILFDLETTFTDPLLWKKNTQNRREKLFTLDELLYVFKKSPCVIEGEAGKGKTTILKRIAVHWASEDCPFLANYKLVFFITLNSVSEGLYETLCNQLFGDDYKFSKKAFMEKIRKFRDKVLFLLDGYDEFNSQRCPEIEDLIKKNYKYKSMVILTTRTETISEVRKYGTLLVETSDFTEKNAAQLINNILDGNQANELLLQLQESVSMKNLMKTPLFVIIACALQLGESKFQMKTQSTLFGTLYDLMYEKSQDKLSKMSYITKECIEENISRCGDLALDGLFAHKFKFHQEDLSNIKEEILLSIGLLNKYSAQTLKAAYRFFHTSFQEYTAGRRLSELLSSKEASDVFKGESYLNKINSVLDITTKYSNLLRYTCGSSKEATCKVIKHITAVHRDDINNYRQELVEFGVSLFYESSTKSDFSKEFETLFSDKNLYLNTHNISSHHFEFFEHLPNCLSSLHVVKLDLFGDCPNPSSEQTRETDTTEQANASNSHIPEKTVRLFFDHRQNLQTLVVTLKDFNKLNKQDVNYLGKICCSSNRLCLHIEKSAGITGTLSNVLQSCKNMQDLIVDNTPLSIEDEKRIVEMEGMKTLHIVNMQTAHQPGGLIYGLFKLQNIEELVLQNININEDDAQTLASGLSNLRKLKILNLSDLSNIGKGVDFIAESISNTCHELQDLKLENCCLTGRALTTFAHCLSAFPKLKILDFSNNYLEEDGEQSVTELVQALSPELTTLLLPGGSDVKFCLDKLLEKLSMMPGLSKLGLKKWNLMDDDIAMIATLFKGNFANLSCVDLSSNCASSDGWKTLIDSMKNLENLMHFNFSTEQDFEPQSDLVRALAIANSKLQSLDTIELNNWQLDTLDIDMINNPKMVLFTGEKSTL
ncbi:NLR family CARD domain-containing protein 4 [Discoglossus pictus]